MNRQKPEIRNGRADITNFELDLFDNRANNDDDDDDDDCCQHCIIKPSCLPIMLLVFYITSNLYIPIFNDDDPAIIRRYERLGYCPENCSLEIVESIPTGIVFPGKINHTSTFDAWADLLDNAKKSIDLSVFYWNLRQNGYQTAWQGQLIYEKIVNASKRGVKIRIVQNAHAELIVDDGDDLSNEEYAEVRTIDFTALLKAGALHTKFWIIDKKHIYIGSANMDWKSLTEVKELGVVVRNCTCTAHDLQKIFFLYWRLGEMSKSEDLPARWATSFRTIFNHGRQLQMTFGQENANVFISSAPVELNPKGREYDLSAITKVMDNCSPGKIIRIAVMDYFPTTLYMLENCYFAPLDDSIRSAIFRGVRVKLLVAKWNHTRNTMFTYLRSLMELRNAGLPGRLEIKLFQMPDNEKQRGVPYTRVNHAKYMVTDKAVYIGTSDWTGDYFINTAGIGFVIYKPKFSEDKNKNETEINVKPATGKKKTILEKFQETFERDWQSPYASNLDYSPIRHVSLEAAEIATLRMEEEDDKKLQNIENEYEYF